MIKIDNAYKTNVLNRLFPEHIDDMPEFEATYDAVFRVPVNNIDKLVSYIIGFAVFHDLTVYSARAPELHLDMHIRVLSEKQELLDGHDTRIRFDLYDVNTLFKTYDGIFRFAPKGAVKIARYLQKNKIKDFKFWAKNQEMALDRDEKGSDNHRKHNIAMGNMLPKAKQLKKKQVTSAKFKTISDEEMDEIAQELAKRKNVKNPDIVLCELISSKTK